MSILLNISLAALLLAINVTLIGIILALGIAAAFKIARNAHPRIRYVIAVSAFFLSILLPVWMMFASGERRETSFVIVAENLERGNVTQKFSKQSSPKIESSNPILPETTSISAENSASYYPEFVVTPRHLISLLSLWAAGSILLLTREIWGWACLASKRRKWRLADIEALNKGDFHGVVPLYLSESEGPLATGFFRQAVVFPARLFAELPAESIRSIARHELNHVRWRDPAINAVLRLAGAVFWFSPPLWYLERAARLEREAAADFAAIVSQQNETDFKAAAADYAKTLMLVARWSAETVQKRAFGFAATEIGSSDGLENRVRRLFKFSEKPVRLRLACAALVLLSGIFGASFLPVASQSFPIALDESEAVASDESAWLEKNETTQVNDSGFDSQNIANRTPLVFQVHINQTRSTLERENDSDSPGLPAREGNTEVVAENPTFEIDEKSGVEAHDKETSGQINLTIEQQDSLREYGVTEGYIEELAAVGYKNLPANTLIEMKKLGVSATFVRQMADFGYGKLSSEELIDFRRHAVSAAYINEMSDEGYGNLPANILLDFRHFAVGADYAREMKALFGNNVNAKQLIHLKNQNVSANWIKELVSLGINRPSANDAAAMRIHGITTDWIRDLYSLGFANLTINDLFTLRVHGITSPFIEKIRTRGIKNPTINELISLRREGAAG
ncbi:MAG TPA: M56 family metallopeptidase [Pyrinomonadaceae bacterium]